MSLCRFNRIVIHRFMSNFLNATTQDQRRHWIEQIVRSLPKGTVTSYGEIANIVYGRHSEHMYGTNRWYVYTQPTSQAIRGLTDKDDKTFPWWKVVYKNLQPPSHLTREATVQLQSKEDITLRNGRVPKTHYLCYTDLNDVPAIKRILGEIETYI